MHLYHIGCKHFSKIKPSVANQKLGEQNIEYVGILINKAWGIGGACV